RLGERAGGWIVRGLNDVNARLLPMRYELVALEHEGAWTPRRGTADFADVVPGRKMVLRYSDPSGSAVADVVHLNNEKMQSPKLFGAATLAPLARPVIRGGHKLLAPEAASAGRERALLGRKSLPNDVTHLRSPAAYKVDLSAGLATLRDEVAGRLGAGSSS